MVLGRASVTSPSTSIFSSLLAILSSRNAWFRHKKARPGAAEASWYQDLCATREHARALFRDRDGVLEVGRQRAVGGRDRPPVVVLVDGRAARRDHRLDRERHALTQLGPRVRGHEV